MQKSMLGRVEQIRGNDYAVVESTTTGARDYHITIVSSGGVYNAYNLTLSQCESLAAACLPRYNKDHWVPSR
jgi:hypothetical protein